MDGICRKSPSWLCGKYHYRINWYIMMRIRKDLCFYDILNSHANGAREIWPVCLFVFVALRPMSTAMVIAGRSVHLTTLFPGQA